jgi:MFS family permease
MAERPAQGGPDEELRRVGADDPTRWNRVSLAVALMSITTSTLPVFLFGALASFMREDLDFGHAELGATAAAFYLTSAVASIPAGHLGHRLGPERTMGLGAVVSVVILSSVAVAASTWETVLALLAVGGVGNALAQPGANAIVARDQPAHLQGTSFGILQTAIPVATLLAGFAVPLTAGFANWRWGFAIAAILALPVAVYGLPRRSPAAPDVPVDGSAPDHGASRRFPLYVLSLAGACAAAVGNVLGAFYVESAITVGFAETTAGMLLIVGSVCGISGRLLWGWLADRWPHDPLNYVTVLLLAGIIGILLIGLTATLATLLVGTFFAFGAGWAWKGLYNLSVVRSNTDAVAIALGVSQMGVFAGSVVGPLGFGLLVEHWDYQVAWTATAAVLAVAALLTYAARLSHDRR